MAARRGAARRWTAQAQVPVEIDWGSPLSRDLLYAGGFSTEAGRGLTDGSSFFDRSDALLHNIASSRGSLHGYYTGNVPPRVVTPYGVASYFNGSADAATTGKTYTLDLTGVANGAASDESCFVICTPEQSTGSQNIMGFSNVWSTSLSDYGRGIGIESGQFMAWGASAVNLKRYYGTLTTLGEPVVLAARFAVDGFLMVNGVVVSSGDMSHSWGYKFAVGNAIATTESMNVAAFKGSIGPKLWWRRGVSVDEFAQLSENAFAILRPMRRRTLAAAASGTTINATVGNAVAAGSAATVSSAITVAATTGNAAAAGATASVASSVTISCGTGNASAAGQTAAIESSITIGAGIGNATAAGSTAAVTAGSALDFTVGNAVAAGAQATVSSAITISAGVGNSVAAGSTADISTAIVVSAGIGNAAAAGSAASISAATSLAFYVGNAVAAGSTANIEATGALNAAEIADAVWDEPMVDAVTARQIMSGMADFLRSRGHLP